MKLRWLITLLLTVPTVIAGTVGYQAWRTTRLQGQLLHEMESADPSVRKRAAWASIGSGSLRIERELTDGLLGAEQDPQVRAA